MKEGSQILNYLVEIEASKLSGIVLHSEGSLDFEFRGI